MEYLKSIRLPPLFFDLRLLVLVLGKLHEKELASLKIKKIFALGNHATFPLLLRIVWELAGGGSVNVAVGVCDM